MIVTGGLVLVAADGGAGPDPPTPAASSAKRAVPPVRVLGAKTRQAALLADGRAGAELVLRRGRSLPVRVRILLRREGQRDVALGPSRKLTLRQRRPRQIATPVAAGAHDALASCEPGRLVVRVSGRGYRRARERVLPVRLDPPDCARFFAPDAFWNSPLPPDAREDPSSRAVTDQLLRHVSDGYRSGPKPTINTTSYAPPIYTVGDRQPRVRVQLDRSDAPELAAAFSSVPLPDDARAAAGSDAELVVWQPSTDTMWEFWQLRRDGREWRASWGGRLDSVSSSAGAYRPPNANWGTTASSLALAGGVIMPAELRRGRIDHALAIGIPRARAGVYALPAQRTDGVSTCPDSVPEGARFRLDPGLDIDALGLDPPVAAIARAAQTYGIVVRDQSAAVAFYARNPLALPGDPYPELFGGKAPWDLLATFPWRHLRLMRMDLQRMPGTSSPLSGLLNDCG